MVSFFIIIYERKNENFKKFRNGKGLNDCFYPKSGIFKVDLIAPLYIFGNYIDVFVGNDFCELYYIKNYIIIIKWKILIWYFI